MSDSKGILLNGYNNEEKDAICDTIKNKLSINNLLIYSGYNNQKLKIKEIISNENLKQEFDSDRKKILMFLNFNDIEIKQTLTYFPKNIERPLFCVLTQNNSEWDIEKLYNDLKLENEEMKKKISELKQNKK